VPALLYGRVLSRRTQLALALMSATQLPLVVAISEIGVSTGRMLPENAAALVGAGLLSVLLFPLIGLSVLPDRDTAPAPAESDQTVSTPSAAIARTP
jgi:hypothetical protein